MAVVLGSAVEDGRLKREFGGEGVIYKVWHHHLRARPQHEMCEAWCKEEYNAAELCEAASEDCTGCCV